MYNRKFTPWFVTELAENEIFVFGSNLQGIHGGGAARAAYDNFGAIWGQGVGLQGKSYAIPTMHGGVDVIKPYVDEFIDFAKEHSELTFLVSPIGCGIAGFKIKDIVPLFADALEVENILLPEGFVEELEMENVQTKPVSWNHWVDFEAHYADLMINRRLGFYQEVKKLRVKEFMNTVKLVNDGFYFTEKGNKVLFNTTHRMVIGTIFYKDEFSVNDIPTLENSKTTIEVVNSDCMEEGLRIQNLGLNPAVLNMASRQTPGGGVISGAGAQEETIFRRSNIFKSLYQFAPFAKQYNVKPSKFQYPLDNNFGGVYTPAVCVFRDVETAGYRLLEKPYELAFISVAGMRCPELKANGMIKDHLIEGIKNKIRTILRIGLVNGHDSLVLGALGCGAFCNPPKHIAKLFHEVLDEVEFSNKYKCIVFAILEDHNSRKAHNPEGNFQPFYDEFIK